MKASVKITYYSYDAIDLVNYGCDENMRFEDLSEQEQQEISDILRSEVVPDITIETIDN